MICRNRLAVCVTVLLIVCLALPVLAQEKGAQTITSADLKKHLTFIASDELKGRNTPSPELKIAAKYLAATVESYGFKSLMPNETYFQRFPIYYGAVSETGTNLTVKTASGVQSFSFPEDFSASTRSNGFFSGEVVFVGFGLSAPGYGWDDYGNIDVTGKIVVMLGGQLPADHILSSREARSLISGRSNAVREKGAVGILTVQSPQAEVEMTEADENFPNRESTSYGDFTPEVVSFFSSTIRHNVAEALIDVDADALADMFERISRGEQVPGKDYTGKSVEIVVNSQVVRQEHTQNVVAVLEGSDPVLKNEYVGYGAHYDHLGVRGEQIYNGADDNGSGTVALLEIAQAFSVDRPKRSVLIVWNTGEEKGLRGARYFTANLLVPLEKISAHINLDMISRNAPDSVFIIGAGRISTELDKAINDANEKYSKKNLDYKYDAPDNPQNFYFRSDHYMYAQYGIPSVFFFTDTHRDYHRPTDTIEKVDFQKMEWVTKMCYFTGYDIANKVCEILLRYNIQNLLKIYLLY